MSKAEWHQIWYSALASPLGVVVETDNPERLKAKLYAYRAETQDPALHDISIKTSPFNSSQLWLVKRTSDAEEGGSSDP